ncbi:TPA: hypothetical protein ACHP1R_005013 [Raoultella ornithinolytica]
MTSKLTREETQQIIDAADAVITALAGTNDEVHKDDNGKMIGLWDDLNDRYAPPVVVRELARMALAAMDSEPVAWMHSNNDIGIPAITVSQKIGHYWMAEFENVQPLYRHAQPAPANEPVASMEFRNNIKAEALVEMLRAMHENVPLTSAQWEFLVKTAIRHLSVYPDTQVSDEVLQAATGGAPMTFEYTGEGNFCGWGFYRDDVEVDVDTSKPFYISPVSIACIYRMQWRSRLLDEISRGKKSPSTKERLLEALFLNLKDDLGLPGTANPQDCEREIFRLREVDEAYRQRQQQESK